MRDGQWVICVVEDEPSIGKLLIVLLKSLGYQANHFASPEQALEAIEKNAESFDLIITDYDMPQMNGKELLVRLKSIDPNLPVILCSGNCHITDSIAKNWGFQAYLKKPYEMDQLIQTINSMVVKNNL